MACPATCRVLFLWMCSVWAIRQDWRVQQLDWHPETEFGALPHRLLSEVRFGVTDDFPYIFFRQFVGCLSEKCYICHKEVKEVVLFAKVAYSALALLPFFVFFEKRLGQYWTMKAKIPIFGDCRTKNVLRPLHAIRTLYYRLWVKTIKQGRDYFSWLRKNFSDEVFKKFPWGTFLLLQEWL